MNQVKTMTTSTIVEIERMNIRRKLERKKELKLLDAPELSQEAKELLVDIKIALKGIQNGEVYTMEEMEEMLFGENGLCK